MTAWKRQNESWLVLTPLPRLSPRLLWTCHKCIPEDRGIHRDFARRLLLLAGALAKKTLASYPTTYANRLFIHSYTRANKNTGVKSNKNIKSFTE